MLLKFQEPFIPPTRGTLQFVAAVGTVLRHRSGGLLGEYAGPALAGSPSVLGRHLDERMKEEGLLSCYFGCFWLW